MENFVREHSVGSVLRNSVRIFGQHFLTIFLIYTLPTFPFVVLQQEAQVAGRVGLLAIAITLNLFMGFCASAAITVAISDICLGERPTVIRSYRKLSSRIVWRLAWSSLLQILAIVAGMILLIVPGFVLIIRLMFTPITVVLENLSGSVALKRSASLGKGYHWRNAGLVLVWISMFYVTVFVFALLGALLGGEVLIRTAIAVINMGLMMPLFFISLTLLYYDLRARKEAYDVCTLAEDLRR